MWPPRRASRASPQAGAVPVYWGHLPSAAAIFNPDAFIACGDDLEACAARVAAVDADADAYRRLVEAPPLAPGGLEALSAAGLPEALAPLARLLGERGARGL